ncbi:MAG: hypothetical protein ABIR39_17020 [Nocardioides sp.]|uniref:hypothetical protein n=1 Tax=Nocardioides sp. TaxID=35761 RepID=UPI0032655FD1
MGPGCDHLALKFDVERLYSAASHHVRSANDKVRSTDRNLRMEAAIHAGAAVELMAKVILVNVDPRLLLDDREGHHVLIDVLVEAGVATAQPYAHKGNKTLAATKAVILAGRLCEEVRPHLGAARLALDARNRAAHAAEIDDAALAGEVTAGSDFVLSGVDHLGRSRDEFLGAELADQVQREVAERSTALRVDAQRKVRGAKDRYESLISRLPDGASSELIADLGKRASLHGDHTEPHGCPACGNRGWLIYSVEFDVEYEAPGDYSTTTYLDFRGFDCLYCSLQLTNLESEAVGIDPQGDPADDFPRDEV